MGVAHSYCDITLVIHVLYMTVYVCMCGEWGVGTLCPLAMRHCDS